MNPEKEKIQRDQLAYSMLRRVIIRADFTSMLDADKIVSLLNEEGWFNTCQGSVPDMLRSSASEKIGSSLGRLLFFATIMLFFVRFVLW